jgi:hypothetical protein
MKKLFALLLIAVATISLNAQTKKFNLGVGKLEKVVKDKMSKKQMEIFLASYNFILRDTIIRSKGSIIKTWEVDSTKKDLEFEYRYKVVFDNDYVLLSARSKNKFEAPIFSIELTVQSGIETYNMLSECIKNGFKLKKQQVGYWIYQKGNMTAIVTYGSTEKAITIFKQDK